MDDWILAEDDPRRTDVLALLKRHLDFACTVTPPEDVHALDLEGFLAETVTLFSLRGRGLCWASVLSRPWMMLTWN